MSKKEKILRWRENVLKKGSVCELDLYRSVTCEHDLHRGITVGVFCATEELVLIMCVFHQFSFFILLDELVLIIGSTGVIM